MTAKAHYAMCLFAESATGIPRIDQARVKLILVPRGVGKSTLITKGRAIQQLLAKDGYAVGIANETNPNAEAFLGDVRMEFETNELLRALFPERIPPDLTKTTWRQNRIVVKRSKYRRDPSVIAAGVDKTVTGIHMDEWICDDLLSQNAAEAAQRGSFAEIEATNRWVTRLEPLLARPKVGPLTFIGTRWWDGDTYDKLEGTEDEPGLFGHGQPREVYDWRLKLPDKSGEWQTIRVWRRGEIAVFERSIRDDSGRSIFPERYSDETLELMELQDPVFFSGQMLLKPSSGGAAEFRQEFLRTYRRDGEHLVYRGKDGRTEYAALSDLVVLISVDPAFADSGNSARSAIIVTATNGREVFLLEDFAQRGLGAFDIAKQVVAFARMYRPRKVIVETIVAQVAVADIIKRVAADEKVDIFIDEIPSHGKQRKTWRIYGLASVFQDGRFYYDPSKHMNFLREFQSFPRGELRDILDALSFQKDEWERARHYAGTSTYNRGIYQKGEDAALARMRRSIGRGGGY